MTCSASIHILDKKLSNQDVLTMKRILSKIGGTVTTNKGESKTFPDWATLTFRYGTSSVSVFIDIEQGDQDE